MAWTQLKQAGAETGSITELPNSSATHAFSVSSTKAYTGARSFRTTANSNTGALGWSGLSTTQMAMHLFLNHNDANSVSGQAAQIFRWFSTGTSNNAIRYNKFAGVLELYVNGSQVDSASLVSLGINATDTWFSCGLIVKANSSTGWVSFYLNGVKVLSGTSLNTGTGITTAFIGGWTFATAYWNNYAYFDDVVLWTSDSGDEPDEAPTPKRFLFAPGNADDGTPQWSRSTGSDNYALVDDVPDDGDTSYVYAEAADLVDVYGHGGVTVPSGYGVTAVIPTVVAKRASTAEQVQIGLTDGVDTSAGTAQSLTADYAVYMERYALQPDGVSEWDETAADAVKVRVESAGTY